MVLLPQRYGKKLHLQLISCTTFKLLFKFYLTMEKETMLLKLGERIREIRLKKGISQKKMAVSIGKEQQSIQRLEQGKTNPSYYYLREVANGLEISLCELFEDL